MGRFGKVVLLFAAMAILLGTAARTEADSFDMTWNGTYGMGSAVLTATNDGAGKFTVTNITGMQGGTTITSLIAPGGFDDNDNFIFPSNTIQIDLDGLSFAEGAADYNMFFFPAGLGGMNMYVECSSGVCPTVGQIGLATALSSFKITSAVPEPSSLLLLLLGLAGLVLVPWKKRATIAA